MAWKSAAAKVSAIADRFTNPVAGNMHPLNLVRRAVLMGERDIEQIGRPQNCRLAKKSPRAKACGDFHWVWSQPVLLQDHQRERIDIGLQHHEHADKARQYDRMPETISKDRTFVTVPVGRGGGDDDRLRVDHLA